MKLPELPVRPRTILLGVVVVAVAGYLFYQPVPPLPQSVLPSQC